MTRHEIRESALTILFEMQLNPETMEEIVASSEEAFGLETNALVLKLVSGVTEKISEIDEIIQKYSPKRTLSRIPKMNLTILRLALYEMNYLDDVPEKVAINEAIELSKEYADKADTNFVNGVLGAYYKDKNNG